MRNAVIFKLNEMDLLKTVSGVQRKNKPEGLDVAIFVSLISFQTEKNGYVFLDETDPCETA